MPHARMRHLKWAGAACSGALVVALLAPPALGYPPQFDTFPTIGNFTPVSLNGTQQLSTATITPFIIDDSSGTVDGWNVTLTIPDLQNGTGQDCSTDATATLPGAGVTMYAPVVTPADGDTSMDGVAVAGFTDFTTPRIIIDAAAGNGAGTYDVSPELVQLTVPSGTAVGTYCTLATIAIASGP
jgi:hypothetical protein